MKHYEIKIKEVGNAHTITTHYVGDVTESYLVKFFGLNNPDVEWYEIRILK